MDNPSCNPPHADSGLDTATDRACLCLRVERAPQRRRVSPEPRQRQRRSEAAPVCRAAVAALRLRRSSDCLVTPAEARTYHMTWRPQSQVHTRQSSLLEDTRAGCPWCSPSGLQGCSCRAGAVSFRHRQRSLSVLEPHDAAVRGPAVQPAFADREQQLNLLLRLHGRVSIDQIAMHEAAGT